MSITVVDAAPDELLTTIEAIKRNLGITDPDEDEQIEDMIRQNSDFIKSYTSRIFARQNVTETFIGKGLPNVQLSITPIISISSLLLKTAVVTDFTIDDAEAGIIQIKTGFTSTELGWNTIDRAVSPYGIKDWSCTYIGGYTLPSWQTTGIPRSLPYDLERACIEMTKTTYHNASLDGSIKTYKVGDTTVSWNRSSSSSSANDAGIPTVAANILDYYRRAF